MVVVPSLKRWFPLLIAMVFCLSTPPFLFSQEKASGEERSSQEVKSPGTETTSPSSGEEVTPPSGKEVTPPATEGEVPSDTEEVTPPVSEGEEGYTIETLLEEKEKPWEGVHFSLSGYYRVVSKLLVEPDQKRGQDPHRLNFYQQRLRLFPEIWLNEKTVLKSDLLVGEDDFPCPVPSLRLYNPQPCTGIFGSNGRVVLDTNLSDRSANIRLVRFWVEITTPVGALRVGRQPSHWGLGLFSNNGLQKSEFGVPHFGDTYDRVAFATKPLGPDSNWITALVWDLIATGTALTPSPYPTITSQKDDIHEGVLVVLYKTNPLDFGVYQVYRYQKEPRNYIYATDLYTRLDIGLLYGALEAVWLYGSSRALPVLNEDTLALEEGGKVKVASSGWVAELGLRTEAQIVRKYDAKVKFGQATGDRNRLKKDPKEGVPVVESITLKPDYQVGLILFPHAYPFLVERGIQNTIQTLNFLTQEGKVAPGTVEKLEPLFTLSRPNGGITNARFVNPILRVEPLEHLTGKVGYLFALTHNPVEILGSGAGAKTAKNLGHEIDLGVEYQWRRLSLVVEGGVFFPGDVFDQPPTLFNPATGSFVPVEGKMQKAPTMYLLSGRVEVSF